MVCPFRALWTELIVAISDRISQTNAVGNELYVQPLWTSYLIFRLEKIQTHTDLNDFTHTHTHTHTRTHTHTHTHSHTHTHTQGETY